MKGLLAYILLIPSILGFQNDLPKICNAKGCIFGTTMPGYQTDMYEAYMGIPYAEPPVGNLRFANPVPIANTWKLQLNATAPRSVCIQKNYLSPSPEVYGEEDCLYLNVYRPKNALQEIKKKLPVMFYIHGGGLFAGSANPDVVGPEYFMDNGQVILVTVAYRLAVFGFLSTGDIEAPGNFGFKDQVVALKWVQQNIEYFDGDPKSVTIFGNSAGAWSAHLHMMSPLSKGLFHRAILMSGSALAPYAYPNPDPMQQARRLGKFSNISQSNCLTSHDLIRELRKIDAVELLNNCDGYKFFFIDPLTIFSVAIESKNCPGAFMTEDPKQAAEKGKFNYVPLMMTFVKHEGVVRSGQLIEIPAQWNALTSELRSILPKIIEYSPTEHNTNLLISHYFSGNDQLTKNNSQDITDLYTERSFTGPLYITLQNYIEHVNQSNDHVDQYPVSIIKFNYKGPNSYSIAYTYTPTDYGVVHQDDLIYLFRSPLLFQTDFPKNSTNAKMINNYVKTFVNFAYTDKPLQWIYTEPCTRSIMRVRMCEYQEIENDANGDIKISKSTNINLKRIKLWGTIDPRQNLVNSK